MQNIEILEETIRTRRNDLERRKEQIAQDNEQQETLETFLQQYKKLTEHIDTLTSERDTLKSENERLKMEQNELGKMNQKLAEKAEHDDLIQVMRKYMNTSKRKNAKKREYIKMVITEMAQSARLEMPEDMLQELEKFDDDNTSDRSTIGEYVALKNVENEIHNIEANGIGVSKNLKTGYDGF